VANLSEVDWPSLSLPLFHEALFVEGARLAWLARVARSFEQWPFRKIIHTQLEKEATSEYGSLTKYFTSRYLPTLISFTGGNPWQKIFQGEHEDVKD